MDQGPIGRRPRSNPATYTGGLGPRPEAVRSRPPRPRCAVTSRAGSSFNVKGWRLRGLRRVTARSRSRCSSCRTLTSLCEVCHGARYNLDTLAGPLQGQDGRRRAADADRGGGRVLRSRYLAIPPGPEDAGSRRPGLRPARGAAPAPTLSGGEAQRVKLATELQRPAPRGGPSMCWTSRPAGLHFDDIRKLLGGAGAAWWTAGNTVIVIEHNLDVIKTADWVVDLGLEGGSWGRRGGSSTGTPEQVAKGGRRSYTGQFRAKMLPQISITGVPWCGSTLRRSTSMTAIFPASGCAAAGPALRPHELGARPGPRRAGERVLEVGCGNGRYLEALRNRGARAAGCDLSPAGHPARGPYRRCSTPTSPRCLCATARRPGAPEGLAAPGARTGDATAQRRRRAGERRGGDDAPATRVLRDPAPAGGRLAAIPAAASGPRRCVDGATRCRRRLRSSAGHPRRSRPAHPGRRPSVMPPGRCSTPPASPRDQVPGRGQVSLAVGPTWSRSVRGQVQGPFISARGAFTTAGDVAAFVCG